MSTTYITTPIYYVNARPHLGHAYTTLVADAFARYHRAMGADTHFLTGTDEHGDKIEKAATAAGKEPQAFADEVSGLFAALWPKLSITNDDFIRTTEERHKRVVQQVLQKVYDAGDIYPGEYGGLYCYGCEQFLTEKDLVDGNCPDHGTKPEEIREKNWFFRMSKYQQWLIEHIEANPSFIRPERYRGEVLSLLKSGELDDLCISRPKSRLTWGIELPFDTDYVTYVWFDALINYISALEYPDGELYQRYWPAQHFIAKDILKPHAIFWPTMLKAAGIEPFAHLNVHGYWLVRDTKMSKSLGNVVEPLDMAAKYGNDTFRYFLLREMQFGADASFTEEALVGRRNADLANDLGNLFSRVLSMTGKYFDGRVPGVVDGAIDWQRGVVAGREYPELEGMADAMRDYLNLFGNTVFSRALETLWGAVRNCNKFVDSSAPWALAKAGNEPDGDPAKREELAAVMYTLLELMRKIARMLEFVLPQTSATMLEQLGVANVDAPALASECESWGGLPAGTALATSSNLFPRVELEKPSEKPEASAAKQKKQKKHKQKQEAPAIDDGIITFEDFARVQLRMGRVLACEPHPDADRLLLVRVDVGEAEPRQVVAGLAEFYTPDELVGRTVCVVANLAPRKLRGQTSQGMLCAVKSGDRLELLTVAGDVEPGSLVS